jgi:ABC-2 type transport system ATP-binding protein
MAAIFPAKPADWVVDAQGLTKTFGTEIAVNELTIQIPTGKIIGLIGPSGSGKTTTIRLLTGIYAPTKGQVTVLGVHPKDFTARIRERMGYMPQLFVLYPDLTVWENMNFAASLYGLSFWRRGKRIKQLLDFVELGKDRYKLARSISGGMQRRLALAATLVHNPELIFLDEPTAGIDPILRRKFWDQFQELKKNNRTLFITTQYVNEAAYCDYVGVMSEGRLLMMETPEGMRRRAFGGDVIDLSPAGPLNWEVVGQLQQLPYLRRRPNFLQDNSLRLVVDDAGTAMPALVEWLNQKNIKISSIEPYLPPFDDVFVSIVEAANQKREQNQTAMDLAGEEK